jgi:hypothetical protein
MKKHFTVALWMPVRLSALPRYLSRDAAAHDMTCLGVENIMSIYYKPIISGVNKK